LGKAIRDFKKGISGDELEDLSKELKTKIAPDPIFRA
jgi:hypothetical protein